MAHMSVRKLLVDIQGSVGLDKESWLNPEPRFLSNSFMKRV